jgi:DNA replication protein DnaC
MLTHPTLDRLRQLRLHGMADAYAQQRENNDLDTLTFDERLGFLVDREASDRESRKLTNRLRRARLKQQATLEDIDYGAARGLDKALVRSLAQGTWIRNHQNILIVGATGTGKTYLACALAHRACLDGFTVRYHRLSRLLSEMLLAKADGSYPKLVRDLAKTDVIVLDLCRALSNVE